MSAITIVTDRINKHPNIFGNQYSYQVVESEMRLGKRFNLEEYINDAFHSQVEFKTKAKAIKRMMNSLMVGDTGVEVHNENEYCISFQGYNQSEYRFDKILFTITKI